jgi:hypothetical protein
MANEISNKIKGRESLHDFYQIVKSSEDLLKAFVEFFDDQSPTFKFCCSYIELVEILLEFLYSERENYI